jgi:hypothetical protein
MRQISNCLDYLSKQLVLIAQQQYNCASNAIEMADAKITCLNDILRQIDELEDNFDRTKHIRDIVRGYWQRVD